MNKFILPFTLLLIVCFCFYFQGCVTREQFVENQIYTCTQSPKLKVKVNNDLKYLGNFKRAKTISGPDFSDNARYETFLFADSEDGEIRKALLFISQEFQEDTSFTYLTCTRVDKNKVFLREYIYNGLDRQCRIVGLISPAPLFKYLGIDATKEGKELYHGSYIYEHVSQVNGDGSVYYRIYYMEQVNKAIGTYVSGSFWDFDLENLSTDEKKAFDAFLVNSKKAFTRIPN